MKTIEDFIEKYDNKKIEEEYSLTFPIKLIAFRQGKSIFSVYSGNNIIGQIESRLITNPKWEDFKSITSGENKYKYKDLLAKDYVERAWNRHLIPYFINKKCEKQLCKRTFTNNWNDAVIQLVQEYILEHGGL